MSGILPINRRCDETKSFSLPRERLSRGGGYFGIPLVSRARILATILRRHVIGKFRATEDGVDAAVPVDAQNASTRNLENCTDRSFPQRPHRSPFLTRKNGTTKNAASVPI
jgi:hypothetical protein